MDVTRYNDTIPGLTAFEDKQGNVRMQYAPDKEAPILDINFTNIAEKVLGFFGLKEKPVDKFAVEDKGALIKDELKVVTADIKTMESNSSSLTKEASTRLSELKARESELKGELKTP